MEDRSEGGMPAFSTAAIAPRVHEMRVGGGRSADRGSRVEEATSGPARMGPIESTNDFTASGETRGRPLKKAH
jgi:hypothetical protein